MDTSFLTYPIDLTAGFVLGILYTIGREDESPSLFLVIRAGDSHYLTSFYLVCVWGEGEKETTLERIKKET